MASESLAAKTALAAAFALALLLPGIGSGYWGRDEAEYAEVARGMNATGDYLLPRAFGRLLPEKPPLSEWLTAASFRLFGESEASARLPHVLLAAGSAALTLLLGARLFGPRAGSAASLFVASSLLFVVYGRLLLTDSGLLFFTLLSTLGLRVILEGGVAWWPAAMAGAALGLAILAKGPIALLAPALFLAGSVAGGAGRSGRAAARLSLTAALALAVAGPWFWLAARATSGQSVRAFWLRENVSRFLAPMEGHRGPFAVMLLAAWVGFFPWSGLLVALARRRRLRRDPARWGLLAWAAGVLLFFSVAATKLPHYLLPALPAIALLAAEGLEDGAPRGRAAAWATAATGAALILAGVAAVCYVSEPRAFAFLLPLGCAGLFSLLLPLCGSDRSGSRQSLALAVLASAAIAWGVPFALDPLQSTDRLGRDARGELRPGEPLGGLRIHEPSLIHYSGAASATVWQSAAEVAAAAAASPTRSALLWLDSADAPGLARAGRCRVRLLDRGPNVADPRVRGELALARAEPAGRRGMGAGR